MGSRRWLLLVGLTALLSLWVHRFTLGMFFGPDDLIHMEQASGIRLPPTSFLRIISQVWYFKAMLAAFGPEPLFFHAMSLLVHAVDTILLMVVLRRGGLPDGAAILSGLFFGCHPLHFVTLLYAVDINDPLAALCLLLAIRALQAGWRWSAWIAAVLVLAGLFCKESIVAVSAAVPLLLWRPRTPLLRDLVRLSPVWLVGGAFVVVFFVLRTGGLAPGGSTYAIDLGPHVLGNSIMYWSWAVDGFHAIPDLGESATRAGLVLGGVVLVALGAMALLVPRSRPGIAAGALWFLLAGLPVFLLARHPYAHYLYVPLMGSSTMLGSAAWTALTSVGRRRVARDVPDRVGTEEGRARPSRLLLALIVLCTLVASTYASHLVVERIYSTIPGTTVPRDPVTRKAVVGGRAIQSVRSQLAPGVSRIVLYADSSEVHVYGAVSGKHYGDAIASRGYDLLASVLDDGRAFRLFFPGLSQADFVSDLHGLPPGVQVFRRNADGTVVSVGETR